MKNIKKLNLLLVACFLLLTIISFSQPPAGPPPGGTGGATPPCWAPTCVPIDGGLGFLIAAGALLGVRRLRSKN